MEKSGLIDLGKLRLVPALVPAPLWGRSVHNALTRKKWEALRRTVLANSGNTCRHCDAQYESGMVCHEVWEYDDADHVATLAQLIIVCRDCNSVLHLGKSLLIGQKGGMSGVVDRGEQAVRHLMRVNSISDTEARSLITNAFKTHKARSRHNWRVEIGARLFEEHPVLRELKL